jgi:hypothetical protein
MFFFFPSFLFLIPMGVCQGLIRWAADSFSGGTLFATYEQILPHDPFGQTMMQHLQNRGCSLRGLLKYPDIPSQKARFLALGYTRHAAFDMNHIYRHFLARTEVGRGGSGVDNR